MVGADSVSLESLIAKVKAHPKISKAGMILCHNGIVREFDRSGARKVSGLRVAVNRAEIEGIRLWAESQPGIVAVEIQAFEGDFRVGDDLLFVVVAGDIRENVFAIMRETVDKIKTGGVAKTEFYSD